MRHLVVQLYGIGNLVQTEPLMRHLEEGDILVDSHRSTHEMANLFPGWQFYTEKTYGDLGTYDHVWLCGPWLRPADFLPLGKHIHAPVWHQNGEWTETEARVLLDMAQTEMNEIAGAPEIFHPAESWERTRGYGADGRRLYDPYLPRISGFPIVNEHPYIVMSCGYNRSEGTAWAFKDWGRGLFYKAMHFLLEHEMNLALVGTSDEWDAGGGNEASILDLTRKPLIDQIGFASGCLGYLGNDTGWAHICGAYGLPSAVYVADPMRQDPAKNRTASPCLWQFNGDQSPEKVADWLLREVDHAEEGASVREGAAAQGEERE